MGQNADARVYGTPDTGSLACLTCDQHGLRYVPRVCVACARLESRRTATRPVGALS